MMTRSLAANVVRYATGQDQAVVVIRTRFSNLWWLMLAAGTTNATFNWAVTLGDVVRVVLLFYLMPLWAVLLSRGLLGERLSAASKEG